MNVSKSGLKPVQKVLPKKVETRKIEAEIHEQRKAIMEETTRVENV